MQYLQSGGANVGVQAVSDIEHEWPWYDRLVGASFSEHRHVQEAIIQLMEESHPFKRPLAESWMRTEAWYNFRTHLAGGESVQLALYEGGWKGGIHLIAWCLEFDGDHACYTGDGHTDYTVEEPESLKHLLGGICWAAAVADFGDKNKSINLHYQMRRL